MSVNKLILGDNLEILKGMESESVDLIYLDPPFFSNRNYEVIWGDEGEVRSFQDRWSGGIDHYIAWLKERVEQMHRILKPTGSIFLHCDWHADAYIRVQILDKVFSYENFINHITWKRKGGNANPSNALGIVTDSIFWYSKTKKITYNQQFDLTSDETQQYIKERFVYNDENGRKFMKSPIVSPNPRPNLTYDYKGYKPPKNGWSISLNVMEEWDKAGKLYFPPDGTGQRIYRKIYLDEYRGQPIENLWQNIFVINPMAKERIGYPTQKPEKLLERIIEMASNEGDIIFDPFVGGGTTVAVADKLKRKWIGIDQSVQAVKVTELRLQKQQDLFSASFTVQLHKYDYDTLRYTDAFEFESWIIQQFGGTSNTRQRNDFGLDGKMPDNTPIQVKRSDNIGRNVIDNFLSAVKRADKRLFDKNIEDKKPVGYIIAFSFGKGAIQEVARLKLEENIIIKLVTVEEIVPIAKKPTITVQINELSKDEKGVREIEFIAAGQSEAGIEFYSWDFNYDTEQGFKADIMLDKEGKQTAKLKAGTHNIAVKVIDNDGLESIEVIKLKVNGVVERE